MSLNPAFGSNGTISGCTAPVIQVYPPASAQVNGDLLEMSGSFAFFENKNGQAIFQLTAAVAGNLGRTIQLGGLCSPTITPPGGGNAFGLVTFPKNICLCWTGGAGVFNGLFVRALPFPPLGLTA